MADGREERDQQKLLREQDKRKDWQDRVDRGPDDEGAPERGGS